MYVVSILAILLSSLLKMLIIVLLFMALANLKQLIKKFCNWKKLVYIKCIKSTTIILAIWSKQKNEKLEIFHSMTKTNKDLMIYFTKLVHSKLTININSVLSCFIMN